jgi:hypothetical protein
MNTSFMSYEHEQPVPFARPVHEVSHAFPEVPTIALRLIMCNPVQ